MDRFSTITAFVAVADEAGFAPAARRLGLATSSVTRQVDALEAHLGHALVNRSTHGISLTPAGERYLARARRLVDDLEAADAELRDTDGEPTGTLRVSMPIGFGRMFVAPMIPAFLNANPRIKVELVASDRMVDLVEERIDVAIRLGRMPDSSLVARRLADHERVIVAAPAFRDRPVVPEDLRSRRAIAFDFGTGSHVWHMERDGRRLGVRVDPVLTATVSEVLVDAVTAGEGIAMMPLWLVADELRDGRLERLFPEWRVESGAGFGAIRAVTLPHRRGSARIKRFVDALADHIGSPPLWER